MIKSFLILNLLFATLGTSAHAASKVLAAESLTCGGLVTLEKTDNDLLILRVAFNAQNSCPTLMPLKIESQGIGGEITNTSGAVELNPHAVGSVLPLQVGEQNILIRISDQAQAEVRSSYTSEDLANMQRRQEEIARRQRSRDNAAVAGAGAAVFAGGAAVAAAAAASTER